MERQTIQKISDICTLITLIIFLSATVYGLVEFGNRSVADAPVWLLFCLVMMLIFLGRKKDG